MSKCQHNAAAYGYTFSDWLRAAGRDDSASEYDLRAAWRAGEDPLIYAINGEKSCTHAEFSDNYKSGTWKISIGGVAKTLTVKLMPGYSAVDHLFALVLAAMAMRIEQKSSWSSRRALLDGLHRAKIGCGCSASYEVKIS